VPRRVAQLYASSAPPCPPCFAALRAVLLFADVSGYSALTRWMARHFEQGPWATGRVLNKLFGGMAACVHAHGGDILKFAGARPPLAHFVLLFLCCALVHLRAPLTARALVRVLLRRRRAACHLAASRVIVRCIGG
jgi:class 3 adenylate cyclase